MQIKNIIKKQGGFTLLELLIVIVIIGILALLIIPNITSAPKKARDTQRKTDLRAVQKGLEEYFVSNNNYPAAGTWQGDLTGGTPPIMKAIPSDPKGAATPYVYTPSGTPATSYKLEACLENAGDNGTSVVAPSNYGAACTTKAFELTSQN